MTDRATPFYVIRNRHNRPRLFQLIRVDKVTDKYFIGETLEGYGSYGARLYHNDALLTFDNLDEAKEAYFAIICLVNTQDQQLELLIEDFSKPVGGSNE